MLIGGAGQAQAPLEAQLGVKARQRGHLAGEGAAGERVVEVLPHQPAWRRPPTAATVGEAKEATTLPVVRFTDTGPALS